MEDICFYEYVLKVLNKNIPKTKENVKKFPYKGGEISKIDFEIDNAYSMKLEDAANYYNIKLGKFKIKIRAMGIRRWPNRKYACAQNLKNMILEYENKTSSCYECDKTELDNYIKQLYQIANKKYPKSFKNMYSKFHKLNKNYTN
tara:strand:- start:1338 stop:1772 length:435 start_codon:yes stop_codon:yes gene_type:complete